MRKTLVALCLSLLVLPSALVRADSWLPPAPKIFANEDGDKTLKIVPAKEGPARASWVRLSSDGTETPTQSFPLVNMPVQAVLPQGRFPYFVTLDTYARVGYAHALVIYRDNGEVVRDFQLEDLLTAKEIQDHVTQTAGSRWWRNGAGFKFVVPATQAEDVQLHITFTWGKQVDVRLKDGKVLEG